MIIWLASYPRSGNTFLRVILNTIFDLKTFSIHEDETDIGSDSQISEVVGHVFLPSDFDIEKARKESKLYLIKTHNLPDERIDKDDKVVYLLRDGRECATSYRRYISNFTNAEKTIEDIIYSNVHFGAWGQHVKAWNPLCRQKTLLIKFESLVDNPEQLLSSIADFIGVQQNNQAIPLFNELNQISPKFFNSGKKNSWKSDFSIQDEIAFYMKNHVQMLKYGYVNDRPEVFEDNTFVPLFEQLSAENSYQLKETLKLAADLDTGHNAIMPVLYKTKNLALQQAKEMTRLETKVEQCIDKIELQTEKIYRLQNTLLDMQNTLAAMQVTWLHKLVRLLRRLVG